MATSDFVNLWGEGDNSFEEDPPNAVLAFLEPGDEVPTDAVVVIQVPRLENGRLSYSIQTLEGTVPAQAGPVTLFIDPFGRPLSPVSVLRRAPARAPPRPQKVLIARAAGRGLIAMSDPPLSPNSLLRLAPGVRAERRRRRAQPLGVDLLRPLDAADPRAVLWRGGGDTDRHARRGTDLRGRQLAAPRAGRHRHPQLPSQVAFFATLAATLFLPVIAAVGIGVGLSLLLKVNQEAVDLTVVQLTRGEKRGLVESPAPATLPSREVTILDVYGSLLFAGARTLQTRLPDPTGSELPVVVLRLRGRTTLGATAFIVLADYAGRIRSEAGQLFSAVSIPTCSSSYSTRTASISGKL